MTSAAAPTSPPPIADSTVATFRVPQLMPWLSELKILTKDLHTMRLGDVMNPAQRAFVEQCQQQLNTTGRIRQIVLKARQMGFSTIIEGIVFLSTIWFEDMNALVIAHEEKASQNLLKMTKRYWRTFPFKRYHIEGAASKKQLFLADRRSNVEVATANNTDSGRSSTVQVLHASEVAFWGEPEELMRGLRQIIPSFGFTAVFMESTANGVGNYFHRMCTAARRGTNEYQFNFYAWWQHPEYVASYIDTDDLAKHAFKLTELDDEEQSLVRRFDLGMDRLLWRRWAIQNLCEGSLDTFHQEYPSDPDEAFLSTGRNVFPLPLIIAHADLELGNRGRLVRDRQGRLSFHADAKGHLTVYRPPSPDTDWGVYLIGADPTHTTAGDNACAQVINRRTLEQVAVYRRKTDPITFAKDIELLGRYYNDALIAPEKEGPGYATIGALVASGYVNLYQAAPIANVRMQGIPGDLAGWSTNVATKHLAISHLLRALKDPLSTAGGATYGLQIHDEQTAAEMRDYTTTEDGRGYTNSDGSQYDDGVMAMAIALAVHNIELAVPAYVGRAANELPPNVASGPVGPVPRGEALSRPNRPPVETDAAGGGAGASSDDSDIDSEPIEPPWEAWGRKD